MIKIKFTPAHLRIMLDAFVSPELSYTHSEVTNKCIEELIQQGLVFIGESYRVTCTAYGERKLEELLLKLNLPEKQ